MGHYPASLGTPARIEGALAVTLELDYGAGSITAPLKDHGLQRIFIAQQEAPGGYIMIQGKLAQNGTGLLEAGSSYQPPPPPKLAET